MDNISRFQKTTGVGQILDESFARRPEREAIVFGDWRITYRELQALIYRTGALPAQSRHCAGRPRRHHLAQLPGGHDRGNCDPEAGRHRGQVQLAARAGRNDLPARSQRGPVRLLQAGARGLGRRPAAALCRTHHVPVPDAGSRRPLRPLFPARRYAGHAGGDRRCARRPRLPHAHEWHDRAAEVRGLLPRALSQPA